MAILPSSGALSISAINAEFGRGNNLNSYRGTTWYTAAGGSGQFSSGAISMSEFYGKGASIPVTSYVNPLGFNGNTYLDEDYTGGSAFAYVILRINGNGTWQVSPGHTVPGASGTWATPTVASIGVGRYVSFTVTSTSGSSTGTSWHAPYGWYAISINRDLVVSASSSDGTLKVRDATYNVQIATDYNGTNIVASGTVTLSVKAQG